MFFFQNELRKQLEGMKKDHEEQMEKLINNCRAIQHGKDELENELSNTKVEKERLVTENTNYLHELQKLSNNDTKLKEECDFYMKKCKQLEDELRLNVDENISQLTQTLVALSEENDGLKQQNKTLENEVRHLSSMNYEFIKFSGSLAEENIGFNPDEGNHEESTRQKSREIHVSVISDYFNFLKRLILN